MKFIEQFLFCFTLMSLTCFNFTTSRKIKKLKTTTEFNLIKGVRYVEVIKSDGRNSPLQISQLVVRDGSGINIAKNKPANATSSYGNSSPSTAVDGVEENRSYPNIFHSGDNKNDKFTVDLQDDSDIKEVVYYNRRDCCRERIKGAVINLLDSNRNILGTYRFPNHESFYGGEGVSRNNGLEIIIDKFEKPIVTKGIRYFLK